MAQKLRETHLTEPQGMAGTQHALVRVREVGVDEKLPDPLPDGTVLLAEDDGTPVSDWQKAEAK